MRQKQEEMIFEKLRSIRAPTTDALAKMRQRGNENEDQPELTTHSRLSTLCNVALVPHG